MINKTVSSVNLFIKENVWTMQVCTITFLSKINKMLESTNQKANLNGTLLTKVNCELVQSLKISVVYLKWESRK